MRFLTGLLLTALLSFLFYLISPSWWWAPAFFAAIVGFGLQQNGLTSFGTGFLSVFTLWLLLLFLKNNRNAGLLLQKMKGVLKLPFESDINTLLVIAAIGGLLGGLSMVSGKLLRDVVSGPVKPTQKKSRRRRKRR